MITSFVKVGAYRRSELEVSCMHGPASYVDSLPNSHSYTESLMI